MSERVLGRKTKAGRAIGASTACLYVAAMVDLWKQLLRQNVGVNKNPREGAVARLLKNLREGETKRKKETFVDRGIGTALDGYNTADKLASINAQFWKRGSEEGLRDLTAFSLCHSLLLRGEDARCVDLADMSSLELTNEGHGRCIAVQVTLREGKTNRVGRSESMSFIRNKRVDVCPVCCLAFYLFMR